MTTALTAPARRIPPVAVALVAVAAAAWAGTIAIAVAMSMGPEAGTLGLGILAFVGMWTLMMAAMMLPAIAPLATLYARTVRGRPAALASFTAGYVVAWAATGMAAYLLADRFDNVAEQHPAAAHVVAVVAFAACGVYQLTPLKGWCLRHCRSPIGHLMHYAAYRGRVRHLRAGAHHGLVCIGCCWTLMMALIAVGVMNIPVMVGIALLITLEKQWRHGERLALVAGAAALVFAVAVAFDADLAPGLVHGMDSMSMGAGPAR